MTTCPVLETERLTRRPFREDDLDAYFTMMDTPELRESLRIPDSEGKHEAFHYMASKLGQWELCGMGYWALEERTSGRLIGETGLSSPATHDAPGVAVVWGLHPDYWGNGYATEAGTEAIQYGFNALNESRLFSCILPDNHRSQAVAQRLGFELAEVQPLSYAPHEPVGIWTLDKQLEVIENTLITRC